MRSGSRKSFTQSRATSLILVYILRVAGFTPGAPLRRSSVLKRCPRFLKSHPATQFGAFIGTGRRSRSSTKADLQPPLSRAVDGTRGKPGCCAGPGEPHSSKEEE